MPMKSVLSIPRLDFLDFRRRSADLLARPRGITVDDRVRVH